MQLHIIYPETDMLVSKRPFSTWREIQDGYENFKASLGPWEDDEVIEYLVEQIHFAGAQYRRDIGGGVPQLQKRPILGWYEPQVGLRTAV